MPLEKYAPRISKINRIKISLVFASIWLSVRSSKAHSIPYVVSAVSGTVLYAELYNSMAALLVGLAALITSVVAGICGFREDKRKAQKNKREQEAHEMAMSTHEAVVASPDES
jgi:hypothetical protein